MLLAVLADTHLPRGGRRLPDECVEVVRRSDLVLHAGDFTEVAALEEIEAVGAHLHAVHGNVDSAELRARLPETRIVEAAGARIAMIHDAGPARGRLRRMRRRFPDAVAVVFGHSHIPLHERAGDGFQIFNPGSPTDRRRQPLHTMGLAHVEGGSVRFELVELRCVRGPKPRSSSV